MRKSNITCPQCSRITNLNTKTDSCWKCGHTFTPDEIATLGTEVAQNLTAVPAGIPPMPSPAQGFDFTTVAGTLLGWGIVLAIPVFLLVQCTSITLSADERELNAKREELSTAESSLSFHEDVCFRKEIERNKASGQMALAEWDMAAAENVDNVSKEQEWEIRKALGRELGLAPQEVNGWKDIYRGRAEAARRQQERVETEITELERQAKDACKQRDDARLEVDTLQKDIRTLEARIRKDG